MSTQSTTLKVGMSITIKGQNFLIEKIERIDQSEVSRLSSDEYREQFNPSSWGNAIVAKWDLCEFMPGDIVSLKGDRITLLHLTEGTIAFIYNYTFTKEIINGKLGTEAESDSKEDSPITEDDQRWVEGGSGVRSTSIGEGGETLHRVG